VDAPTDVSTEVADLVRFPWILMMYALEVADE
jgi:hypothetical protein